MKSSLFRNLWIACLGLVLLAVARPAAAQQPPSYRPLDGKGPVEAGKPVKELEDIGIEDLNGATIPRDVRLNHSDGRPFIMGEYMDGEWPLILVFAYYGCPMLCSLVLNGTMTTLKGMSENVGTDFRVLVVSFDPRDKTDVALEKRANYIESYGRPLQRIDGSDLASFEFATGEDAEVRRLADSVGFRYRWDDSLQQFAHAAGIFIVTPKGVLSQALTGIDFPPAEVSAAVKEASQEVWHSPLKSVLLFCFRFDPHTGKYTLIAARALRVAAGFTVAAMLFWMFRLFRSERKKALDKKGGSTPIGHAE